MSLFESFKSVKTVTCLFGLPLLICFILQGCDAKPSAQSKASSKVQHYEMTIVNPDYQGVKALPSGDVLIWGTDGVILRSDKQQGWQQNQLGGSQSLRAMAHDASGKKILLVGEQGQILFSSDAGKQWQSRKAVLSDVHLNAVAYIPHSHTWVVAGDQGHLLSSSNDGQEWQVNQLASKVNLSALMVLDDGNTVLLGGDQGLLGTSRDAGKSWQLQQVNLDVRITGFYQSKQIVIGLTSQGMFLFSDSAGQKWQTIELPEKTVATTSAVVDEKQNAIMVSSANGVVARSVDAGKSWDIQALQFQGQSFGINHLIRDNRHNRLWLGGQLGVVGASNDGGSSWQLARVQNSWSNQLLFLDHHQERLISVGQGGMLYTAKSGKGKVTDLVWKKVQENLNGYYREGVLLDNGRAVVLGTVGEVVVAEKDKPWRQVNVAYPNPQTPPNYRALVPSPKSKRLIAAGPTGAILASTDGGLNWKPELWTPFDENEAFTHILVDHHVNRMVALEAQGRFYVSDDDGESWHPRFFSVKHPVWHGALSENNGTMVVVGSKGSIYVSRNRGQDWEAMSSGVSADLYGTFYSEMHQRFFAVGQNGVLLRADEHARNWKTVTLPVSVDLRRVVTNAKGNVLLAFGAGQVVLRSKDGGVVWKVVSERGESELRAAVMEPKTHNVLIVGSHGVLLRSRDDGMNWEQINTGTLAHFRNIIVDEKRGDLMLLGERIVRLASVQSAEKDSGQKEQLENESE